MSPRRLVVVDTNVVVAGLLTADPEAPTARILDAMLAGRLRFALSVALLAEYRAVLLRSRIQDRHGLGEEEIDTILAEIARNGIVVAPAPAPLRAPDPGDQFLWDLLDSTPGAVLVTGDADLRGAERPATLGPRQLADEIGKGDGDL